MISNYYERLVAYLKLVDKAAKIAKYFDEPTDVEKIIMQAKEQLQALESIDFN